MSLLTLLLGRRLSNTEAGGEKITEVEGVPAMGLDALSSAAYGPEAALTILLPLGAAGLTQVVPITVAVLLLLFILFFSYWQTIEAYPSNGGSYTVASDNLGAPAGLLAGTALMVDYTLNVAVGISAGVAALTSAVPALHPWTLPLCLAVLGDHHFAQSARHAGGRAGLRRPHLSVRRLLDRPAGVRVGEGDGRPSGTGR